MNRRNLLRIGAVVIIESFFKVGHALALVLSKSFGPFPNGDVVPVVINGKIIDIDRGIAQLVDSLNKGGIETISSCCGHGETDGFIHCKNYLLIVSKERDEIEVRDRYLSQFVDMAIKNYEKTNPFTGNENDK